MDYIETASAMRAQAWEELVASKAFRAFRAADNMVVELGGESVMPRLSTPSSQDAKPVVNPRRHIQTVTTPRGLSQSDAAAKALSESAAPIRIQGLMTASKALGAKAGGKNPLANFRSALSKDDRFYSFRHNGEHWWWLTGKPLPEGWEEAADNLPFDAAASESNSQEGGDSHAATIVPN